MYGPTYCYGTLRLLRKMEVQQEKKNKNLIELQRNKRTNSFRKEGKPTSAGRYGIQSLNNFILPRNAEDALLPYV